MSKDQLLSKFYYPCCKEKDCGGILRIEINQENYAINYKCEKNNNHQGKDIYFKTFETYYLREREAKLYKCSYCNSTICSIKLYKCKNCKKFFCDKCFQYDTHILKNYNKFIITKQK